MLVVLRPEAEQELLEAQAWYESKALGLGFEFARAAEAAVASALRNPFGHLRIEEEFRRVFGWSGLVADTHQDTLEDPLAWLGLAHPHR